MKKSKMSLKKRIAIGIIVPVVTFAVVLSIALAAMNHNDQSENSVAAAAVATDSSNGEVQLYEDDLVKISYVEVFEEKSVPDMCYLRLLVENKSDQEITVYLKDSSVNDTMVQMLSGTPMTIEAGKQSQQPFCFSYKNLDVTQVSDISKIEFKACVVDANTATLEETGNLTIDEM